MTRVENSIDKFSVVLYTNKNSHPMRQEIYRLSSVEKALNIPMTFNMDNYEPGTVELSQRLGFNKTTAHCILLIFCQYDFLQQNSLTRKFKLGPSASEIGRAVNRSLNENLINMNFFLVGKMSSLDYRLTTFGD